MFQFFSYYGGGKNCEFGDVSFIHCLTGWLPEPIPLKTSSNVKLWKLLLQVLPNWTLPPPPPTEDENLDLKGSSTSVSEELLKKEDNSKQELTFKDSKTDGKPGPSTTFFILVHVLVLTTQGYIWVCAHLFPSEDC